MALTQVKALGIAADAIDETKLADNSIDSEHYNDGSIDNAHIADDAIDSEHYAAGSIDNEHLADDAVDSDELAAGSVDIAHLATGTDGQIITWNASGVATAVGPGSDGQVLTSTGAGSPPAFEAVPAGGKILQVVEVKATGTSSFTSTTYADYSPLELSITAATGSKIIVLIVVKFFCLGEASIGYGNQANFGLKVMRSDDGFSSDTNDLYTSSTDAGGKYAAFLAGHDGSTNIVLGGDVSNQFYDESPGGDGSKNITYKVQAAKGHADMGTLYLGKGDGSSMILIEVGA